MLPGIPRVYTAIAEWGACLVYILPSGRRINGWKLWLALLISLAVQCAFLALTNNLPIAFWIPCMAAAAGLMFVLLHLCRGGRLRVSAYCCIHAFLLAELAASLLWQLQSYYMQNVSLVSWKSIAALTAVYGVVFLAMGCLVKRFAPENVLRDITLRETATAVAIGVIAFAISNLSYVTEKTPFSGQYEMEIMNIRTLVDLGGVVFLFAHMLQCLALHTRRELDATQKLLDSQYRQYQNSRDNIESLNMKYHDLKHQIEYLRMESDQEKRNSFLDKMADEIQRYEAENKTGNPVLDILLTSKGMVCKREKITFTAVADGKLIAFMDTADLCSLIGNALDNAIECEKKIQNPEKRLIHLTLSSQKSFVLLRIENYCDRELRFSDGLPITTKRDPLNHGYGLKSVLQAAKKYGGCATVKLENNWFELKVLFPQHEDTAAAEKEI